jgi:hypothetical protein
MPKQIGISMAMGGVALLIASMVTMNLGDYGKRFPVFLIGGGVLLWMGIQKYRAAI